MPKEITLEAVKAELGVYWNDQKTDERINRYITEGKAVLCDYAGSDEVDFSEGTVEGVLLMSYIQYAWNKQTEYFEENYKSKLINLRLKYESEE